MGPSFRQTIADIFSKEQMNDAIMIEGHRKATIARAAALPDEYLIAAQDTTFYNYSGQTAMQHLGTLQGNIKGILQHNVLLLSQSGQPLGIIDQQHWSRHSPVAAFNGKAGDKAGDKAGEKDSEEHKESYKWHKGLQAVNKHLSASDKKVVVVQDREADIFSFFKAERKAGVELLVRVHQPRNLEVLASGKIIKLAEAGDHLPVVGSKEVKISRQGKTITLTLSLQAGAVQVLPDKGKSAKLHKTLPLSLVIARQTAAVDESGKDVHVPQEAAEWYLLSSLPAEDAAQAGRMVDFYAYRWQVERFHYTMKSGALHVEKLQFDDVKSTIAALAFYSVVGWQLLNLSCLLKAAPETPAAVCFDEQEIAVLEAVSKKEIATVKQAALALGKLVNFVPTKKQPVPGIKVLAQALERFHYLKTGFFMSKT